MPTAESIIVRRQNGQIWCNVRSKWLLETREEAVRQEYLSILVNDYQFPLDQIDDEVSIAGEQGNKNARADFVIWRTFDSLLARKCVLSITRGM
jgi:type I restriction enzyme M protein